MSKLDNLGGAAKWLNFALITAVILSGGLMIHYQDPAVVSSFPPKPAPVPVVPTATTLFLAGDIMLSRNVAAKINENVDEIFPFINVADTVKSADLSFANLESPFLDRPPYAQQGLVFKADPKTVAGLTFAGFDILSTANNHGLDQNRAGVEFTLKHLAAHGITPVGSGLTCPEGQTIERNGIKFGFLAYSYAAYNDGGKRLDPLICRWEERQVVSDVERLKPQVDFLIVSVHAGTEYKREPDAENVRLAHLAVDAGADMIVGHHPHWIQTIESYRDKWIFYSLGNFVFDQMWSIETKEGLTVSVHFKEKTPSRIELRPVIIENYCCPRWTNEEETKNILLKLGLTSDVLMDKN